jgi:hypothetical protein
MRAAKDTFAALARGDIGRTKVRGGGGVGVALGLGLGLPDGLADGDGLPRAVVAAAADGTAGAGATAR